MITEQMTIHEALVELKTIENRIEKALNNANFLMVIKNGDNKISGKSKSDFQQEAKASFDKIKMLIDRRNAIKQAVVKSNASTIIDISGEKYTVAEDIDMKNEGIKLKKKLLDKMINQYNYSKNIMSRYEGNNIEEAAEEYVNRLVENGAGKKNDKNVTVSAELIKALREEYIKNNTYELVDPIKVERESDKIKEEIEDFMKHVDSALSVSNALTVIKVNY